MLSLIFYAVTFAVTFWNARSGPDADYGSLIYGGKKADPGQFPYQLSIGFRYSNGKNKSHICGGSIISDHLILTAAHCFFVMKYDKRGNFLGMEPEMLAALKIKAGLVNLRDTGSSVQEFEIPLIDGIKTSNIVIHPDWGDETGVFSAYDFALVKLPESKPTFTFVRGLVEPIQLAKDYYEDPQAADLKRNGKADRAVVAGWGATEVSERPTLLRWVDIPIQPNEKCARAHHGSWDPRVMICAGGEKGKDSCQGDSGGALAFKIGSTWKQVGVVSFGRNCGSTDPAVYAKVSSVHLWISTIILEDHTAHLTSLIDGHKKTRNTTV